MESQKIGVGGDQARPSVVADARRVASVTPSYSASAVVEASIPRARSPRATAFGMCSSVRNLTLATQRAESLVASGWRARAKRFGEGAILCHARVDFLPMIEVVGERCVDVG